MNLMTAISEPDCSLPKHSLGATAKIPSLVRQGNFHLVFRQRANAEKNECASTLHFL
jgi:hypothetical protein